MPKSCTRSSSGAGSFATAIQHGLDHRRCNAEIADMQGCEDLPGLKFTDRLSRFASRGACDSTNDAHLQWLPACPSTDVHKLSISYCDGTTPVLSFWHRLTASAPSPAGEPAPSKPRHVQHPPVELRWVEAGDQVAAQLEQHQHRPAAGRTSPTRSQAAPQPGQPRRSWRSWRAAARAGSGASCQLPHGIGKQGLEIGAAGRRMASHHHCNAAD